MAIINIFDKHTPDHLKYLLNGEINEGDAHELHNACMVLCNIAGEQSAQIVKLQEEVKHLRDGYLAHAGITAETFK